MQMNRVSSYLIQGRKIWRKSEKSVSKLVSSLLNQIEKIVWNGPKAVVRM